MPREPAYDAKRSHDGEAPAASERAAGRMPDASGRRRGTGGPEPTSRAGPHRLRDCGFLKHTTRTATQVRIAHAMAASWRPELSEGLPVPREPAYAAKRSQDGEAPAASE